MKTLNFIYSQPPSFKKFILEEDLDSQNHILIQIFSGVINKDFLVGVINEVKEILPKAIIIGSTTDGEIDNSSVSTNKTLLSISVFEKTKIIPFFYQNEDSFKIGEKIALNTPKNTKLAIMFSDGLNSDGEDLLNGINSKNKDLIISGGMAGDNGEFVRTFVFSNGEITDNGVTGIYLQNENLYISTTYNFGWLNLGKIMTVTDSYKNIVYKIDGLSPVELYKKYLGKGIAKKLPAIGIEFPLILIRNGVKIARAVLKRGKDGSLIFAGNIKKGEKVQFGIGDIKSILDYVNDSTIKLSKENIESIFIYSCMARRRFMRDKINIELQELNAFGTISGFYTYGEFFSKNGNNNLHNETSTILALSESKTCLPVSNRKVSAPKESDAITAFRNLIKTTSKELEELNKELEKKIEDKTKKIKNMLYIDSLTKVFSKSKLLLDLKTKKNRNLILLNIDNFSNINLAYGFEMGDFILKSVTKRLESILKFPVYRVDSDEFAILCDQLDCINSVKKIKDDFFNNPITIEKISFRLTFSFGIAPKELDGDLLKAASTALKDARNQGKNRWVRYSEDTHNEEKRKELMNMTTKLFNAIRDDKLVPFYQGIKNNKTGEIEKYEVLIRMIDGDKIISPFFFLNIAKVAGLLITITKIVIDKSFKYMQNKNIDFSINVTEDDFADGYLVDYLVTKSEEFNIKKDNIYIEILEGMSDNKSFTISQIKRLKDLGFNISIDDFGTEYSNFERIQEIQADILKIDGRYIKDIDTNPKSYKIAKIIKMLADEMGMKVIAEFVHNEKVQKIVEKLGIEYSQGYLYSEPKSHLIDNANG